MSFNMWKLFNKLFGWDYVHWQQTLHTGISRVRVLPDGSPYYRNGQFLVLLPTDRYIQVTYLTCTKEKYLK